MAEESGLSNLSMLTRVVYDYEVERNGLITVKIGRRADFTQPVVWTRHEGLGEDDAIDKAAAVMLCNGVKPTLAVKTATEHLRVITDHHNENNLFCGGCGLAVEVLADVEEWLCPDCCSEDVDNETRSVPDKHNLICKCGNVLVKGADTFHSSDYAGDDGCFWNIEENKGGCGHNNVVTKTDIVFPETVLLDY